MISRPLCVNNFLKVSTGNSGRMSKVLPSHKAVAKRCGRDNSFLFVASLGTNSSGWVQTIAISSLASTSNNGKIGLSVLFNGLFLSIVVFVANSGTEPTNTYLRFSKRN